MSYVDIYTETVVIQFLKNGMWSIRQNKSVDRKCLCNDSEVTIKVKEDIRSRYAKYAFLRGKINSVIVSLVLLILKTEMAHFHTLSYTSAREISTFFIPEA